MKTFRFLAVVLSIYFFLLACTSPNVNSAPEMNIRFAKTVLLPDGNMEFQVYIDRPDLNLTQPDNPYTHLYTSDLPVGLRVSNLYVSDLENSNNAQFGTMCDTPRFPYTCNIERTPDDDYYFKVLFEDGVFLTTKVHIPYPTALKTPEITFPTAIPKQADAFSMKFNDVGADEYSVSVEPCSEYQNNGINPCLDREVYYIERVDGVLTKMPSEKEFTLEVKDGVVSVSSDLHLIFGESLTYDVLATKKTDNVSVEASSNKTFTL